MKKSILLNIRCTINEKRQWERESTRVKARSLSDWIRQTLSAQGSKNATAKTGQA